ncbi:MULTISPECIES: hypothetical protein [Proteus]|uniref:hypothetical protein n=1 Tax=Proteus TaxID=583 RepID=UPI00207D4989|nr:MULTISPECIES: hypothetical protein [Proteus]MCO4182631.1 hypothetical protein [Proteus terrae]MCO4190839.1 hypothetical protein [Proteus terrae]
MLDLDIITNTLVGLISGVMGALFTAWIAFTRFYKEKLWEKKYEVYSRLFEAIYFHKKLIKEYKEDVENQFNGYGTSNKAEEIKLEMKESLEQVVVASLFILNKKVHDLINDFFEKRNEWQSHIKNNPEDNNDPDVHISLYNRELEEIDNLTGQIVLIARKALRI